MTPFLVAPSILSADFANLQSEVERVTAAGADWIHVDVMDGQFVPNLTIGAPVVKSLKRVSKLPLDVHLMIVEPERYIKDFAKAGADYLTIHVESTGQPEHVLREIKSLGVKPGLTLKPETPVEALFPLLKFADLILIMTVNPGFGGQIFMQDQVEKIAAVRSELKRIGHSALIEVDGGINAETAQQVTGADVLVAGNYIFANDVREAIQVLKRIPR